MTHAFLKDIILIAIGIVAFFLLIAEGDTFESTCFIKVVAFLLVAFLVILNMIWKKDVNKQKV